MEKKYEIAKKYIMDIVLSSENNTKIPSERDLMEILNFSRPTVQKAINTLEAEGYLYKIDKQGTFTIERTMSRNINRLSGFTADTLEASFVPQTEILEYKIIEANDKIAKKMMINPQTKVHYCLRIRKRDDEPIMLDFSYFADFCFADISENELRGSLYDYIENKKNLAISHSDLSIDCEIGDDKICKLLCLEQKSAVLRAKQVSRLKDGRIFEYTISYSNPEKYKLNCRASR